VSETIKYPKPLLRFMFPSKHILDDHLVWLHQNRLINVVQCDLAQSKVDACHLHARYGASERETDAPTYEKLFSRRITFK
jgi:hypothetical protein